MAIASALFLASNSTVHAQTAAGFATVPVLDAVQATRPPVIDGTVAETEWQGATVATSFIQFEPRRGERSDIRS
jgi:hypothetical protein